MMRVLCLLLAMSMIAPSCKTLSALGLEPSALETAMALREVLDSSTFRALKSLKNVKDGGLETILPSELQPVLGQMRSLGLGGEVDKILGQVQDVSLVALSESEGVISDAVKSLSFKDAAAVVLGGSDAATGVLKNAMYASVKQRYSDRLEAELQKTEAAQYWPMAAGAYNLFAKEKVEGRLSDFLAERAVDGVFLAIGKEEKAVRANYKDLGKSVVTKVFDYYTKTQ